MVLGHRCIRCIQSIDLAGQRLKWPREFVECVWVWSASGIQNIDGGHRWTRRLVLWRGRNLYKLCMDSKNKCD